MSKFEVLISAINQKDFPFIANLGIGSKSGMI